MSEIDTTNQNNDVNELSKIHHDVFLKLHFFIKIVNFDDVPEDISSIINNKIMYIKYQLINVVNLSYMHVLKLSEHVCRI